MLERFWWGSVFVVTVPLAIIALALALRYVPAHVNETTSPVDNLGGILSVALVGAVILAISFAPVPGRGALVGALALTAVTTAIAFYLRQRRASSPLYDLHVAARPTFWVAACAGIIVFGSLLGAMFIGQQFLQNVLGYSTIDSGLAVLPAAALMVLVAPRSARLVESRGSRFTLLTGSVPVTRAGMASGTADLQRDLGGAVMQSAFGALLTAGYVSALSATIASAPGPERKLVTSNVQNELTKSFGSAAQVARQYPRHAPEVTAAAKAAFLHGDRWAYATGIVAVLLGAALVRRFFPPKRAEHALLQEYHASEASLPR